MIQVNNIDAITPLGNTWESTWKALIKGEKELSNSNKESSYFSLDEFVSSINCIERSVKSHNNAIVTPALRLFKKIVLTNSNHPSYFGTTNGDDAPLMSLVNLIVKGDSPDSISSKQLWRALLHDVVMKHSEQTMNITPEWVMSACASSMHATIFAAMDINCGIHEKSLVYGIDSLSDIGVLGFKRLRIGGNNKCSPMLQGDYGMRVGEAAAVQSLSKNQKGEASLVSFSMRVDPNNGINPEKNVQILNDCILDSVNKAGIELNDIDAIYAHGTGTEKNDILESKVIFMLFNNKTPVTSIKGSVGHTMGAAGILNNMCAIETIKSRILPAVIGTGEPIEPISLIRNKSIRLKKCEYVLTISSGFGGNYVSCIFKS